MLIGWALQTSEGGVSAPELMLLKTDGRKWEPSVSIQAAIQAKPEYTCPVKEYRAKGQASHSGCGFCWPFAIHCQWVRVQMYTGRMKYVCCRRKQIS